MTANSLSSMLTGIAPEVGNHLWQSTVFAGVVWLLALSLRRYQARTRYWLWLAGSAKFLVPFSLLVSLGSRVAWSRHVIAPKASVYTALDGMSQPFSAIVQVPSGTSVQLTHSHWWIGVLPILLAGLWLCGFVAVLGFWSVQWLRIYAVMRNARLLQDGREVEALRGVEQAAGVRRPIAVMALRDSMEPGVFGVVRPILLWPERISERLDDAQLEAVLAHEVCHVQRRDNLTSLLHMVVEAVFWFHPLVWWMEGRLVEERERACDEEVLRLGKQPVSYAESILKVCEFCVESPLACVSGITGADLKKRIASIMAGRITRRLNFNRQLGLAVLSLIGVVGPVAFGTMRWIPMYPQILHASGSLPSFEVVSIRPWRRMPPPSGETIIGQMVKVDPGKGGRGFMDRISMILPMEVLIASAYNLPPGSGSRIIGGPDWLRQDIDQYQIQAKIEDSQYAAMQKMTPEQQREQVALMQQSMLADRFKLKVHFETREMPVYALVVAKGSPKLIPAKDGESNKLLMLNNEQGREMTASAVTLDQFVHSPFLMSGPPVSGHPVVDQTGLKGAYDFTLRWAPEHAAASEAGDAEGPDFYTALQKQLGLKLVPSKGPVEVLVIDYVERPSAN